MVEIKNLAEETEKQHTAQADYLTKIRDSMLKLKNEELVVLKNIDTLNGAMQAYYNALKLLQDKDVEDVDTNVE